MEGQDWASYQAARPSTSGIDFVAIKATEGTSYVSTRMPTQVATARTAGLQVDFYHFVRDGDMKKQAAFFLSKAAVLEGDGLWLDWEDPSVTDDEKDIFIKEVKRLRPTHRVGLYCNLDYWLRRDNTGYYGDMLWIADPNNAKGHPAIQANWLYQQYSSKGGVDHNYSRMTTRSALKEFMNGLRHLAPVVTPPKATKPPVKVAPKPTIPAFPGRSHFVLGKSDSAVTKLGQQLVRKGFKKHNDGHKGYNPGPRFTQYDKANLRDFQLSKKELKHDADGYPGPVTWKLLFS
jgi:hypothetical protein